MAVAPSGTPLRSSAVGAREEAVAASSDPPESAAGETEQRLAEGPLNPAAESWRTSDADEVVEPVAIESPSNEGCALEPVAVRTSFAAMAVEAKPLETARCHATPYEESLPRHRQMRDTDHKSVQVHVRLRRHLEAAGMVLLAHEYQTRIKDETYCPDMIFEWKRSHFGVLFVHCEVKALETAALAYLHGPPRRKLLNANRKKREKLLEQCMRAERLHAGLPGERCYLGVLCDLSTGAWQVPVCRGQSAGDVRKCAEERRRAQRPRQRRR